MLAEILKGRQKENNPIRVGATAEGWMGAGFIAQMSHVPGMELVVVADSDVAAARKAYLSAGFNDGEILEAATPDKAAAAIRVGKRVVTNDYTLAAQVDAIDIITDATPSPEIGAQTALSAIEHGKDVVLINIEADVTVGRALKKIADEAGVLYSVSSGDEPGCLMELYDFVSSLGMEVIVIGKGKNNPLDPHVNPDLAAESARKSNKDPFQVASYIDGTKTMFEMTCAANATGCRPMKRGMFGPEATMETVSEIFALEQDGGISQFVGAVDFVQGSSMAGGVFVTVKIDDPCIRDDLQYLKVGKGKYFTFFRPYHLWFIEAPISIARAHLLGQRTLVPRDQPTAEVMTVAKRSLKPGDVLDTFGGYTFYGVIDGYDTAKAQRALPAGLAPCAKIIHSVEMDEVITWDDVELDESKTVVKLRRLQEPG